MLDYAKHVALLHVHRLLGNVHLIWSRAIIMCCLICSRRHSVSSLHPTDSLNTESGTMQGCKPSQLQEGTLNL